MLIVWVNFPFVPSNLSSVSHTSDTVKSRNVIRFVCVSWIFHILLADPNLSMEGVFPINIIHVSRIMRISDSDFLLIRCIKHTNIVNFLHFETPVAGLMQRTIGMTISVLCEIYLSI